jgi:hypothetical protein
MPGGIERGQDQAEKQPITQNTNNNAPPPFTHSSSSPARKYEPRTARVLVGTNWNAYDGSLVRFNLLMLIDPVLGFFKRKLIRLPFRVADLIRFTV